ncbi:MAG: phenylalanine--tRNA ligase subunit beta [bacterium]|nr:phenylalanine--tRNA ligase subunit beta [bacterium]
MKVSLNWLKNYVDIDVEINVLCDKMIMAGFEVESIEDLSEKMKNVVVGRVVSMAHHEDSDHLWVCQIDVGDKANLQIITGAQNVNEGDLVPVALHDSYLPNGAHIKRGKLRGKSSEGMLCSGDELCLKDCDYPGAEVDGIMILKADAGAVGTDMREVLGMFDFIIDFKITANRPDCQSVLGIAREASVVLEKEFKMPAPEYNSVGGDIGSHISVRVDNTDMCPRYYGRTVKNVRVKESPKWLKNCISSAGMRPINNIVDITNFVMLETGQPMHAFDMRYVKGNRIIVRNAADGETMTTLDGKAHTLSSDMLVIADGESPSCLAGIMGGLESEIREDTTEIFFESAKFRRDSVRRTARKLGIRTESSARFEHGVDILNVEYAMNRALQLIYDLDAGDIVDGVVDIATTLPKERELDVEVSKVNELLGIDIPGETMVRILNSLSIKTCEENGVLHCLIPSFRDDIESRADIAEEVMRIYGYDHIVGTDMTGTVIRGKKLPERIKTDAVKQLLVANGMFEITTYSFISGKAVDTLQLSDNDTRRQCVEILNPLGEEYSVMRTQLVSSMLSVLTTNYNRKNKDARFFEVSKVFVPKNLPITQQPIESPRLCIGMYGKDEDFFTLKGVVEELIGLFSKDVEFAFADEPYLHPGRQAMATVNRNTVAVFGEIHPKVATQYGLDTRVYVAEISLDVLFAIESPQLICKPLPKFPAVERDFALICDVEIPVAALESAIRAGAGKICEKIELFDVYTGDQIEKGKKSVAYRVTLRSGASTLTDEDIERAVDKIFKKLEAAGAVLRS